MILSSLYRISGGGGGYPVIKVDSKSESEGDCEGDMGFSCGGSFDFGAG